MESLKDNLKNADEYITNLDTQFQTLTRENQKLIN